MIDAFINPPGLLQDYTEVNTLFSLVLSFYLCGYQERQETQTCSLFQSSSYTEETLHHIPNLKIFSLFSTQITSFFQILKIRLARK